MLRLNSRDVGRYIFLIVAVMVAAMLAVGCGASRPTAGEESSGPRASDRIDPVAFQHFSVGTIAFAEGDYPTAVTHFERALRFDPDSYEIRVSLAESYFRLRDLNSAITIASAISPQDERALELLGKCYRYAGRNEEAEGIYRRIVATDSLNASAHWYLARLLMRRNRIEEGAVYLERAARLRGDSRSFNELGEVYAHSGQPEAAIRAFTESLRRDSSASNVGSYVGKAEAFEALGQHERARAEYRRAAQVQPGDLSLRKRLINHFLFLEEPDSAIVEIEKLLAIDPEDPERLRLGVLLYNAGDVTRAESLFTVIEQGDGSYLSSFYLGRIAQDREDYATAKRYYNQVITEIDTIPDGWLHLASVLIEQDSLEAARALAERAADKVKDPKSVWHFMGITHARRGEYDSALIWLQRAYAADSTDSRVQFAVASALERVGRFAESAVVFSDLLRREPDNAAALNYLGYMYADSGVHLEESLQMIERALVFEPENGAYLDSHGWVLFRLGRLEEAEGQIRKALDVEQADAIIYKHLGDILEAQGRLEEAREHWQRALEIDPDITALKDKLE